MITVCIKLIENRKQEIEFYCRYTFLVIEQLAVEHLATVHLDVDW